MSMYLPLILTLSRLILSPTLIPFLCVNFLPDNYVLFHIFVAGTFALVSLTDFFDGYFARKFRAKSELGEVLDHVADKFLLYSTAVALVAIGRLYYYWAIIFIGREFLVMMLRQVALSKNFNVKVSLLGKIKTFFQLACLFWIILNPYYYDDYGWAYYFNFIEYHLLVWSLFFTLLSAVYYIVVFVKNYKKSV